MHSWMGGRASTPTDLRPSPATSPYHRKLPVLQREQGLRWSNAKWESQRDQDAFYKGPREEVYECKVCGPSEK
jgi:hypothetical protein